MIQISLHIWKKSMATAEMRARGKLFRSDWPARVPERFFFLKRDLDGNPLSPPSDPVQSGTHINPPA
ncbi:hypothetical protein OAE95_02450, partial [Akkermansiaceae bacterium]|nr:hypothetical protein [Akkermansiaceae bacterium]